MPLFRRIHELGVKVVLTGDGSDELFGGYPMYYRVGPEQARRLFLHKIRNLCRTELQRVDRASMGHGVEVRVPFLDLSLVELAMRLPTRVQACATARRSGSSARRSRTCCPTTSGGGPKNPMSHSSGLHERARLFKPLFARLHRSFGYDLLEPMRRDFDTVLERCGHDLDRAIADGAARPDYTLAGAGPGPGRGGPLERGAGRAGTAGPAPGDDREATAGSKRFSPGQPPGPAGGHLLAAA